MAGNAVSVSVLALAGCLICLGFLAAAGPVRAQSARSSGNAPPPKSLDADVPVLRPPGVPTAAPLAAVPRQFDFDIPAMPLAAALNLYAAVSERPALFDSEMTVGRTSSSVRGRYSPEAALHLLLEGTDLVAEKLESNVGETFLLKRAGTRAVVPNVGMAELFNADGYPGLVQARIWEALCADSRTAPGRYSSLLRFQVDAAGRIYGMRLLGSTGDSGRDAALLEALQHVQIDLAPPPTIVAQPLTMMVLPSDPKSGPQCMQAKGRRAP